MTVPDRVRWTPFELAMPGQRAAAAVIDIGMFAVVWVAGLLWLAETGELGTPARLTAPRAWVWLLVVWVTSRAYDAAAVHLFGGTVGARIVGIEVRAVSGALPTARTAVRRSLLRTPALLTFGAGATADAQRRALHDRVAGTVVVRCDAVEAIGPGDDGGLVTADSTGLDATEAAIRHADLPTRQAAWLRAIADQTVVRLDIANPSWRRADAADTIRQRAFCLLLAQLAARYPDQRAAIVAVLDHHDALSGITGDRAENLTALLADTDRARRWVGLADSANLRIVLDDTAATPAVQHVGRRG